MTAKIDIRARVFGADDHAYRIFPGTSYRHYDAMKDHSLVFLDYPGLPFPGETGYEKDDDMRKSIIRGEQYARVVYRNSDRVGEMMQEIANQDLERTRWSKKRELALAWVNALYHRIGEGDLIVVPAPINRFSDDEMPKTMVGEVSGPTFRWQPADIEKYSRASLLARRVRWLSEIDDRDLDVRTLRSLRTQNALVRLRAENLRPVLGAAYKNVILDDEYLARFVTTGPEFDARESYHFQAFVLAIVEAYRKRGLPEAAEKIDSIYAMAAAVRKDDALIPEQDFSIHSPGYTTLKGNSVVFVVAALFATAINAQARPFSEDGQRVEVELENSSSVQYDPCEPEGLENEVRETLDVIGFDRWQEACRAAQAANEDEGFQPESAAE